MDTIWLHFWFMILTSIEARVLFSPIWKSHRIIEEPTDNNKEPEICYTEQCKETAAALASNMNLSADPCTDFYEFACGGWIRAHPVPKTESNWNQFNLVNQRLDLQLKDSLELSVREEEPLPVKNAKKFYKVCMEDEKNNNDRDKPVKQLISYLKTLGGWPAASYPWRGGGTFSWSEMVAEITRTLGIRPLILVAVAADRKNSSYHIITIDQPSLVVPRTMLVDMKSNKYQIEAYKKWVRAMATLLAKAAGQRIEPGAIKLQADEIVQFEIELAKIMSTNEMRRNVVRTYNPMTMLELQSWTDLASPFQINWQRFVKGIFKDIAINIDGDRLVIVREVDYLFKLIQLIRSTPNKVLANYLHWRVVEKFSRELNDEMRKLAFDFEQVFTGASMDQPRWKECVQSTGIAMDKALGYIYVHKYFDNTAKQVAEEMSANIKEVFSEQMDYLSWMDDKTRKAAKIKVDKMSQLIGCPSWYNNETALEDYYQGLIIGDSHFDNVKNSVTFASWKHFNKINKPTSRSEWVTSPAIVNAYYSPNTNSIIFPAGILQPPFFGKKRIEALNYGGIGVVIGHEITHGFDDVGRHSDAQGNYVQWWSEETIQTYLEKAHCFIKQYGSYRVPELDTTLLTKATVNGILTLGENIADNGGLHSALTAYRKYVTVHGTEPRLPGLEKFSPEQLFFIGFAANWCETSTKESLLNEVLNDPHSPHKYRVEGTLENSIEFSKAFNCPKREGKPLCTIW